MLNKFSQQRNIEGWIVQIFVVIGGFALFFKEMGFRIFDPPSSPLVDKFTL